MSDHQSARPLKVLQLTDPHLMAREDGALLGVNTRESLSAVIEEALRSHGQPDLVLATGDISQDASVASYHYFGQKLEVFQCPSAWIAGNHDDSATMYAVADEFDARRRQFVLGGWHFVMLDSSVHGKVYGELSADELAFLDQSLSEHSGLPAMVCLHHHPVDIGSDWMNQIGLKNREAFWQVIDKHPQVKVVLWSRSNQDVEQQRNSVQLLAYPSTGMQLSRCSGNLMVEPMDHGARVLELDPCGRFTTVV